MRAWVQSSHTIFAKVVVGTKVTEIQELIYQSKQWETYQCIEKKKDIANKPCQRIFS